MACPLRLLRPALRAACARISLVPRSCAAPVAAARAALVGRSASPRNLRAVKSGPASDAIRLARVAARSGLWRPRRPDRWVGAALALRRFGPGLAGAVASAGALYDSSVAV